MDIALSKNLLSYTKKNLEGFVILSERKFYYVFIQVLRWLSTSSFLLGRYMLERLNFLIRQNGLSGIIIRPHGQVHTQANFCAQMKILPLIHMFLGRHSLMSGLRRLFQFVGKKVHLYPCFYQQTKHYQKKPKNQIIHVETKLFRKVHKGPSMP